MQMHHDKHKLSIRVSLGFWLAAVGARPSAEGPGEGRKGDYECDGDINWEEERDEGRKEDKEPTY